MFTSIPKHRQMHMNTDTNKLIQTNKQTITIKICNIRRKVTTIDITEYVKQ